MNVSVFGLGYVGCVTAACLAGPQCGVWGVDVNPLKVELINEGKSPVVDKGLQPLIERSFKQHRLRATQDVQRAIAETDLSLICVGTPSLPNGDLDLTALTRVCHAIGDALRSKRSRHTIVIRSTVLPGTTDGVLRPLLEQRSQKTCGPGFGLCFNPEFLREGSSVDDFLQPPFVLLGSQHAPDTELVRQLYRGLNAELVVSDIRTAEMLKYVNNAYHALKVVFANEVGRMCRAMGIDSHAVMELFCLDAKQNLSAAYLKPGYAFGGSCLPKDLRAMLYRAKSLDVPLELFPAILQSNQTQLELGLQMIDQLGNKKVGVLGLSFKANTDDLRESPLVTLVERLYGRGYDLKIYDNNVLLSRLVGSNKAFIEQELPHLSELLVSSIDEVVAHADTIVVGNSAPEFRSVVEHLPPGKRLVDLVRITLHLEDLPDGYHGIGW